MKTTEIKKFIEDKYKTGNIIYPQVISRIFKMETKDCYVVLETLLNENLISLAYELMCPFCHHNIVHQNIMNCTEEQYCLYCDREFEIEAFNETIVAYTKN